MAKDDILKAASELMRAPTGLSDPRWDELADGALSEVDLADLQATSERSEEGRIALALYRPFDEETRTALVDSVLARASVRATDKAAPEIPARSPTSRRRWRLSSILPIASLAAAAALLLFIRTPSPIPEFTASLSGALATERGVGAPDAISRQFGPGSEIEILLRPATAEKGAIVVHSFIEHEGRWMDWDAPTEISDNGAVRIAGPFEKVFHGVPVGPVDLIVVIGRAGKVPANSAAVSEWLRGNGGATDGSWRLLRMGVTLTDR